MMELDTEGKALAVTPCASSRCSSRSPRSSSSPTPSAPIWVARPDLPPISRFFAGIAAAPSPARASLRRAPLVRLVTAALYLIWLWLDPSAGGEARFALVPLILTQQVFVLVRLLVKVGYYGGHLRGVDAHAVAGILLRCGAGPSPQLTGCARTASVGTKARSSTRPEASSRTR